MEIKTVGEETIYRKITKLYTLDLGKGRVVKVCVWSEYDGEFASMADSGWEAENAESKKIIDSLSEDAHEDLDDYVAELTI